MILWVDRLKLTTGLCFVDDLVVLMGGELEGVRGNVDAVLRNCMLLSADVLRISGLKHGGFPVKCLGVPFSSRKADREGVLRHCGIESCGESPIGPQRICLFAGGMQLASAVLTGNFVPC